MKRSPSSRGESGLTLTFRVFSFGSTLIGAMAVFAAVLPGSDNSAYVQGIDVVAMVLLGLVACFSLVMICGTAALERGAARIGDLDVYHTMFLKQFGAYVLFVCYALWTHPDLARFVWVLMAAIIAIKLYFISTPPIPLPIHLGECFGMTVIGIISSLWFASHPNNSK